MPQVLKDDVRDRILAASLEVFAANGYAGATMSMIAERAEVATANLYRYYASKRDLFDAVVTPDLAERFESLLDRRVRSLAEQAFAKKSARDDHGEEMLGFWIEHRLPVVILLDRAAGTPYARFGDAFVERLTTLTLTQIRAAHPGVKVTAATRFVLTQIFESTRRTLAAILEESKDERALREGIETFWSYQIPGLRGLAGHVAGR